MNRKIKWIGILVILLAISMTQAAYLLPTANDIWHGSQIYPPNQAGHSAYIEYAVYKTTEAPSIVKDSTLASGTYTYAYKIVTFSGSATVAALRLFSLNDLDLSTKGVGKVVDSASNISPDNSYNDGQDIIWEFLGGTFDAGKTSVNLVFTSDFAPVKGSLSLSTTTGDGTATPGTEVNSAATDTANSLPEPTTIALLSFGALSLFRKKN